MKLIFTLLLSLISTLQSAAQVHVTKTTDGRFIGKNIEGTFANDPTGLMGSFVIGFEWWTLMGEPLEIYEFKWNSSHYFKINGEMLHRGALTKYPDLLKRFDALKPSSVSVTIDGMAQGGGVEVKRGKIPEYSSYLSHYDTYKKDGQSYDKYQLYREFKREIKSHKLIIEPAGRVGKDLVPGSPSWADYIEFKQWGGSDWSNTEERAKVTKYLFQLSGQLKQVKASITNITWPEGEMKAILAKYKEYEKKEKDNDKKEKPKKEDDFWSGNTTTNDKKTAEKNDDFWSGNTTTDNIKTADNPDDFWTGKGTREQEVELVAGVAIATGNQFIGEYSTSSTQITIKCRDHGQVDGDKVRIFFNEDVIVNRLILDKYDQEFELELKSGINKISFEALNTGTVGRNTASFIIEDSFGKELYANGWEIETGFKGTLLIIKN